MSLNISNSNISLSIPGIESVVNFNIGKLLKLIRNEENLTQALIAQNTHDQFISYELELDEQSSEKLKELAPHEELKLKLRYSIEIRYKIIPSDCEKLHSRFPTIPGVTPNGIWLYDKKKDLLIYEYKSGSTIANLFYDKNGKKVSEEDYNSKTKEKKIYSENGGYELYKNGILLEKTEVYGEISSVKGKAITHYKDGEINSIEVYDSNSKLLDKVRTDGKKEVISLGKEFLTLIYNHRKDKPINLDIFKFIKDKTKTKEDYLKFEEQYLADFGVTVKRDPFIGIILRDVRNHGLEIAGLNKDKEKIEKKYGIKIEINDCRSSQFTYTRMPIRSVEKELKLLDREIQKYPPGFIKKQNLTVYLVDNIRTNGLESSPRGLYLSEVSGIVITTSSVFDHEFYHRLDDANDGLSKNNSEWVKLSPDYNKDGNKGFTWQNKIGWRASDKDLPKGFARHYGRVNPDEDQATIAECLFRKDGDQSYSVLMRKAKRDKVLMAKINFIKAEYKKWSGGMIDEKYFNDLSDGVIINEAYWEKRAKAK